MVTTAGIRLKKKYGQHFLRQQWVVNRMVDIVHLDSTTSVFEIGCGDGFLTKAIIAHPIKHLEIFEIDAEWVSYIKKIIPDQRISIHCTNFLDISRDVLKDNTSWVVLANLPYQVTFPILYKFQQYRDLIAEGVVMIQEEVAQKITKISGRDYGYPSLFLQWYFELQLLDKIPPTAFVPPPKVFSRLLYFKTRTVVPIIPNEEKFWQFVKICFRQPRRTLSNNLKQSHYGNIAIPDYYLSLRAQQLSMQQLLVLWDIVRTNAG